MLVAGLWKKETFVDIFVLMIGKFPSFTYKGWVTHDYLINEKNIKDLGKGKGYCINQSELNKDLEIKIMQQNNKENKSLQPNNDFLKSTDTHIGKENKSEKPITKTTPLPQRTGGDVKGKKSKEKKSKAEEIKEQEYQKNFNLEKDKYPEYASLNTYHRSCLDATNYWRVMNGQPIIEVPAWDTDYHKYFDKRCYEIAKEKIENDKRLGKEKKEPIAIAEKKIEPIVVEAKKAPEKKLEVKTEPKKVEPKVVEKKAEVKVEKNVEEKKEDIKNNDEQITLF